MGVDVFSPFSGTMAGRLEKMGIRIYEDIEKLAGEKYACIIAQHNILALIVRSVKPEAPMIFVSHGILLPQAALEQPPSMDINIQRYVAVSEEVKNNLILNHHVSPENVEVVRNFVDASRFFPQREINESPKVVLLISNRVASKVYRTIKDACKKLKLKLIVIGKMNSVLNVEDYINKADIVVSLGRGILEAMACGRAAIVYDYQGGDGMITEENITEIRKHNFSGRTFKKNFDITELILEIEKYQKSMGAINRQIILRDYNASSASERIINICNEIQKNFKPRWINVPQAELMSYPHQIKSMGNSIIRKLGRKTKSFLRSFQVR